MFRSGKTLPGLMSADELAIPEFLLQSASELAQRPPEEDPEAVKEFLARSASGEDLVVPPRPEPGPAPELA